MPRATRDTHVYELAKRGAQTRLQDIAQEAKYLMQLFPDLDDSFDSDELPLQFIMARDTGRATRKQERRPRRRTMSATARNAVSVRMKAYWRARRKAQSKG